MIDKEINKKAINEPHLY